MDLSLPFRGSEAVRRGEVGRRRLQGPGFVALDHDVHVLATTPVDLAVRARAVLVRRPRGVIAGAAAAALWEAGEGEVAAVEVQVGRSGARGREGLLLRHDRLEESEIVERDGLRLTSPARTAYDLLRRLPFPDGLAAADLLAAAAGVTPEEIAALVVRHPGSRGNARARRGAGALDARSTPAVSRVRAACLDLESPLALCVRPILDIGDTLVVPDLGDRRERLAVFVGGDRSRAVRDLGLLGRHGWTGIRVWAPGTYGATPAEEAEAVRRRWDEAVGRRRRREHETHLARLRGAVAGDPGDAPAYGQPRTGRPTAESTATATNSAVR